MAEDYKVINSLMQSRKESKAHGKAEYIWPQLAVYNDNPTKSFEDMHRQLLQLNFSKEILDLIPIITMLI